MPVPKLIVIPVQTPTIVPPASFEYLPQINIITVAIICAGKILKAFISFNANRSSEKLITSAMASFDVKLLMLPFKERILLTSLNKNAETAPGLMSLLTGDNFVNTTIEEMEAAKTAVSQINDDLYNTLYDGVNEDGTAKLREGLTGTDSDIDEFIKKAKRT